MIGLSSGTLALVVTFRVHLEGGPSWVLQIAFASFACCIAAGIVAKTTIYLSHVQMIEPVKEAGFYIAFTRKWGFTTFWVASIAFLAWP